MKLRSIILAGLLGGTLLMTSGCGSDDVKDLVNKLAKPNVVYVVNGYGDNIVAHADSDTKTIAPSKLHAFALTGDDKTSVSYEFGGSPSATTKFNYGNAHMLVASECGTLTNGLGQLIDSSTGTGQVEVFNVTGSPHDIATDTITIIVNGTRTDLTASTSEIADCGRVVALENMGALNIAKGSAVQVEIGGNTYPDPAYVVKDDIPSNVDISIVVRADTGAETEAVFVPLIKWDDLLGN